jgi:hypothetical protein
VEKVVARPKKYNISLDGGVCNRRVKSGPTLIIFIRKSADAPSFSAKVGK